jgi:mRNA interferase YafQ
MNIFLHTRFKKDIRKLSENERKRVYERVDMFAEDPFHTLLRNHPLHGTYEGLRSINVGGDIRVVYKETDADTVRLVRVGRHCELYE